MSGTLRCGPVRTTQPLAISTMQYLPTSHGLTLSQTCTLQRQSCGGFGRRSATWKRPITASELRKPSRNCQCRSSTRCFLIFQGQGICTFTTNLYCMSLRGRTRWWWYPSRSMRKPVLSSDKSWPASWSTYPFAKSWSPLIRSCLNYLINLYSIRLGLASKVAIYNVILEKYIGRVRGIRRDERF